MTLRFLTATERGRFIFRLGKEISNAMENDYELRADAVLDGRKGLHEMDDAELIQTGEIWDIMPIEGTVMDVVDLTPTNIMDAGRGLVSAGLR